MQSGEGRALVAGFGVEEMKQQAELAAISVAATSKAMVESAFIMALKKPRNEELARTRLLDRCKDPAFADAAIYSKPVGGSAIEGLSIRFVEDLLALWGNVKIKVTVIFEDDFRRVVNVNVIDLETNTSYDVDLTIDKTVERRKADATREILRERLNTSGDRVFILRATEDEVNIKTAAGVSKAIRNNGLRCVPGHIKEEALRVMNAALEGKIKENPEAERRKLIDAFSALSIKPDRLEEYLGHALDVTTPAELVELRKIYNALKAGETTWPQVMESKAEPGKTAAAPARGSFQASSAAHQGHDQVDPKRQKLLDEVKAFEKSLTKDVFWNMVGGFGCEKVEQLTDKQLEQFISDAKAKLGTK